MMRSQIKTMMLLVVILASVIKVGDVLGGQI